jgi:hypothetical protein
MKNFKFAVFVLLSIFALNSCSSDKEDCKKVKSSSGSKENGVMVYRVTLDNGDEKAYIVISSQYGFWFWLFLLGFLFAGNFIIITIVRFLVFAISLLDPFPRTSLWVIRTYTSIMFVLFLLLIYNSVDLNNTKQFFIAIGFVLFFLYFSWTFYKTVIESQIARFEYETQHFTK